MDYIELGERLEILKRARAEFEIACVEFAGTMFHSDHNLPPYAQQALKRAEEANRAYTQALRNLAPQKVAA